MTKESIDYRALMAELQQILADMQGDGLDVDAALTQHERRQELIRRLTAYLEQAENKITVHKLA
jgi:exodeoxyribonuclease VII small subunit